MTDTLKPQTGDVKTEIFRCRNLWDFTGENILLEEGIEVHNNHYFQEA